jgi:hypothetical protein
LNLRMLFEKRGQLSARRRDGVNRSAHPRAVRWAVRCRRSFSFDGGATGTGQWPQARRVDRGLPELTGSSQSRSAVGRSAGCCGLSGSRDIDGDGDDVWQVEKVWLGAGMRFSCERTWEGTCRPLLGLARSGPVPLRPCCPDVSYCVRY